MWNHSHNNSNKRDHPKNPANSGVVERGAILGQGFTYMKIQRQGFRKSILRGVVSHQGTVDLVSDDPLYLLFAQSYF